MKKFEEPIIEVIKFSSEDILNESYVPGENEGEWD